MSVRLFRDIRGILLESIYWDADRERLVWVDITAGVVFRGALDGPVDGSRDDRMPLPAPVSAVQPASGGRMVAALRDSVVLIDGDGGVLEMLARVEHAHSGMRFNEGKVDPFGAFVVGSMDITTGEPDAAVYRVDRSGTVDLLFGGFGVANGFEWEPDGSVMYLTDTSASTVYRVPYGPDGPRGELDPVFTGHPSDGLARATDGTFRNAAYGRGEVLTWGLSGDVTGRVTIPAPQVTSVAFGGDRGDLLFVGTARENLTEDDLVQHPSSGGIYVVTDAGEGRAPWVFGEDQASAQHAP